jgi:ssDNA-binding replication factor A large subunit
MDLNSAEEIYSLIKSKTNKTDEELQIDIKKIKDKYQGLLSDVGANIMLAKQLNVNLELKKKASEVLKINELNSSLSSASVYVRVKNIPPIKTYKSKDGSEGKLQTVFLFDNTGETKLNLWQDKSELVAELDLQKNDLLFIKDAYINEYNGKIDLSLKYGDLIKDPENAPEIKNLESNMIYVSKIENASPDAISTFGRLINIYPSRSFEDKIDPTKVRKVINFNLSDGIKSIRCTAWSPWAEIVEDKYTLGDIVKLEDVIIKEGLYDLELHTNWNSNLTKNPDIAHDIPPLSELVSDDYNLEKISNLEEGKSYKLEGLIVTVNRNNLRYFKCPKCKERVYLISDDFVCEACNEIVDPIVNLFGSVEIDDGSGIMKCTMFSNTVESFFKLKKEDLKKDIDEEAKIEIFSYLEDELLGKKVSVTGRAKLNDYSSKIEFLVSSINIVE